MDADVVRLAYYSDCLVGILAAAKKESGVEVQHVSVLPAYRRRGVARSLMKGVMKEFDEVTVSEKSFIPADLLDGTRLIG